MNNNFTLPGSVVLELTYRCNHACLFCYCPWLAGRVKVKPELSLEEWKECCRALVEEAGVYHLTLSGGECLLKDGWQELARYIKTLRRPDNGKAPMLNLISNGRAVTDEMLAVCKECDIALTLSLPGLTTYNEHVGTDTDPADVLDHLIKAHEMGISTIAGITITAKNFHEAYQTVLAALLAHADQILLNRFLPGGRGLSHPELNLSREQILELPALIDKALKQANRYGGIGTELPFCLAPEQGACSNLSVATTCGAVKTFCCIGPSGFIRTCNHSPNELVHWRQWRELERHPYWNSYLNTDNYPETCKKCPHIDKCDGGCREAANARYGSNKEIDPALEGLEKPWELKGAGC